jgi:hypothetical protein
VDTPRLLAGKRLYDSRRHIYFGPLSGDKGDTVLGIRELYGGPEGQLFSRPTQEMIDVFAHEVLNLGESPILHDASARWRREVPENYMIEVILTVSPDAVLTFVFRQNPETGEGRRFDLRIEKQEAAMDGCTRRCPVDTSVPIMLRAFVQDTVIECFLNDRYSMSDRDYSLHGHLGLDVHQGEVRILSLTVKTRGTGRTQGL